MFTDFEFADKRLSDFGWVAGYIGGSSGVSEMDIGCDITFNTVKNNHSSIHYITSTSYDNVCTSEPFDIFKNPCDKNQQDVYATRDEIRVLTKWLNRHEYRKFKPLNDSDEFSDVHYYGSFNVKEKIIGDKIVGLVLTFTANAPYGFGEHIKNEYESDDEILTANGEMIQVSDSADMNLQSLSLEGTTNQNTTEGNQLFDEKFLETVYSEYYGRPTFDGESWYFPNVSMINGYTPSVWIPFNGEVGKQYTLSADLKCENCDNYGLVFVYSEDDREVSIRKNDKEWFSVSVTSNINKKVIGIGTAYGGGGASGYIRNIMINEGTEVKPCESYTGGVASPNPHYEQDIIHTGILNEAGKYEVTITLANAEEKPTVTQTVTITSDRPITKWDKLVERDGVIGWLYRGMNMVLNGTEKYWEVYSNYKGYSVWLSTIAPMNRREGYCNQFRVDPIGMTKDINSMWLGVNNGKTIYVYNVIDFWDDTLDDKGLANFKAHLNEHPLEIWTYSDTEEFVPLSDAEQDAIRNIMMYSPITVITSDQNIPLEIKYIKEFDNTFSICGESDEYKMIYPNIAVTCKQDGDLRIKNSLTGNIFEVLNCSEGETIYVNGEHKFIDSDNETHKSTTLFNDFNYNYLDINVSEDDFSENIYETSMPCKIVIDYSPIRKVGV